MTTSSDAIRQWMKMEAKLAPETPITLCGCRIILRDRVLENSLLRTAGGRIREFGADRDLDRQAEGIRDLHGQFVAPGFVDVHCHGDSENCFFDRPETVSLNLLQQGVTSVNATLGYPDMSTDLAAQLRGFHAALGCWGRQIVAGIHLEGPYVNRKYGAQTSRGLIKMPDRGEYSALLAEFAGLIKWWTCAPELPGAIEFITAAAAGKVIVAAGHTEAGPDEVERAIRAGLSVITHWSNATGNPKAAQYIGTRMPGIDEAALVFDELFAEIIPDEQGLHVHPLMARLLFKAKTADRILIITDSGYRRSDDPADEAADTGDVSIDSDGNLAGSKLDMARASRNFQRFTGCSWPELFRMAALNPARMLGLDNELGSIAVGHLANLVVFADDLKVTRVFLKGLEVPRLGSDGETPR